MLDRVLRQALPDVIIAGVGRCGTTSLFRYLSAHPSVCPSRLKETAVLLGECATDVNMLGSLYDEYFSHCEGREDVLLEASPQYVLDPKNTASKINKLLPDSQVILIFRNPIERLRSVYTSFARMGALLDGLSFEDFLNELIGDAPRGRRVSGDDDTNSLLLGELDRGDYAAIVDAYVRKIKREKIHICFLETLMENPVEFMRELSKFVGIDGQFYDNHSFYIENRSVEARSPSIYKVALILNSKLEPLLNRVPVVRHWMRVLHSFVNEPVKKQIVCEPESRRLLLSYYQPLSLRFKMMLDKEFPEICQPRWLQDLTKPDES